MPDFAFTLQQLSDLQDSLVAQLRESPDSSVALNRKRDVDAAIAALQLCAAHGIHGNATVTKLPMTQTSTPSSEYRLVEDHETDDPQTWTEVVVNDEPIRPTPWTLLVDP
ncbi:hypothetical protein CA13_31590 [Planctomycetes bacterium CA13]|uniref:Uncharacterized protein n=1 Tax=Novipirellula herctigrandis TaxID=2527986 RepID=A0A5C5Z3X8_9BACT|nr:hypothetical protein CA13_31590 [Planctomycetes bacterium CA13]